MSQETSFHDEDVEGVSNSPSNGDGRGKYGSVRLLVVEDHQPFRQFVCSSLTKRPELQIVGEVSDGLEAVSKAEELQPDLILLDIGLPSLNGIDAGRRIRKVSPESKILFVTQESSDEVVREALNLGAWGYIVKARAASDLFAAVEAVCQGKRFVSAGLVGRVTAQPTERHFAKRLHSDADAQILHIRCRGHLDRVAGKSKRDSMSNGLAGSGS
jgi:DNA-binding NarL/FixJ family response regulator